MLLMTSLMNSLGSASFWFWIDLIGVFNFLCRILDWCLEGARELARNECVALKKVLVRCKVETFGKKEQNLQNLDIKTSMSNL